MKQLNRILACFFAIVLICSSVAPVAFTAQITDDPVSALTAQLEAIDTLQEIQNKRNQYTASGHYDITTTSQKVIDRHNAARIGYETYVDTMFAARVAAQNAYDALTPEQKAQIDPALVAKLSNELPTVFHETTLPIDPSSNEYTFEAVRGGLGYAYEVSNHMVSGNIPQTFILVDTSDGKTSWTPNGLYEYGKSNYDVCYCCDVKTGLEYYSNYKRLNLEDSHYYGKSAAEHIRAIVLNSYPYVSVEEMRANLKADGMRAEFVDSLTRADMIAAVQQAIWTYANSGDDWNNVGYFASIDVPRNSGIYFTALHDYTNESWDWFPSTRTRSYNAEAAYRVNNLAYYLCTLDGLAASEDSIIISKVDITRASLIAGTDDTYAVGMHMYLNTGAGENDSLSITVASHGEDGSLTDRSVYSVNEANAYDISIFARRGDRITVTVQGTQFVGKSVYFYEPEGGRDSSQCLVGVGGGATKVKAEKSFLFNEDIDMGIRIHKTATGTGLPLSDITFDVYNVVLNDGESVGDTPTEDDLTKYVTSEFKVGSVTTDVTGYASLPLDKGLYLVVEQHNEDKVKAPVNPFFIDIPAPAQNAFSMAGAEAVAGSGDIVSAYPKNEPVEPPEEPPHIPPPFDNLFGSFSIIKHDAYDETKKLSGASFRVFRPAEPDDTNTQTLRCGGIDYAVVPVTVDGNDLVLTTDENGAASSPRLACSTYFLVETKAPKGYDYLTEALWVTVKPETISETEVLRIANYPGALLPETGGKGTNLMISIGSVTSLSAAVFLITEKKMHAYE